MKPESDIPVAVRSLSFDGLRPNIDEHITVSSSH